MKKHVKNRYSNIMDALDLEERQKDILKSTWYDYFVNMDDKAYIGLKSHRATQIIIIALGLLIPLLEKSELHAEMGWGITIIGVMGALIAFLTALSRHMGWEEKWRHYRLNTEIMRNEADEFFALAGKYQKSKSHKDAFPQFMTNVTAFKNKEIKSYISTAEDSTN